MSWINFHDILLDPYYTAFAIGGPELETAEIETQAGINFARPRRYDYISRYTIDYAELDNQRRKDIRKFHLLRWGKAFGFRFLAPDDSDDDGMGVLVDASMNVVSSVASGSTYYLAKRYVDVVTYLRRIVKPDLSQTFQILSSGAPIPATIDATDGHIVAGTSAGSITWAGHFHLPVRFTTDFNEMKTDETQISEWSGIGLRELLPIALGITI
jgi:uncharacterized protein (TIGR02217 family)